MTAAAAPPFVTTARWVTIKLAAQHRSDGTAIRRKIEREIWLEGRHWRKADGGMVI